MTYEIIYEGNVKEFEDYLVEQARQEVQQKGRKGIWCRITDIYVRQLSIIKHDPFPPEETNQSDDENPPSIKHLKMNVTFDNFYRWGIPGGRAGNHRILFAIHNYHKVVLLHYFDKQYNGAIHREDIEPAEACYEDYCIVDPFY
ncbi:type II toxin-antitoxin system RelE/ParE family toxin [Bacillus taeanensis]|uniref:Uncharacterized protein n=1 Tax=Bacillus taeanensis TaxID=273032 RepID=A0A366XMC1_9BACI|nr:type II toxin-antitoxin system RelE/ParE family toxin [Bacillus taeanensis]RBW67282.1 hypothetical protein DS031_23055 [Bacillus taeanensis]